MPSTVQYLAVILPFLAALIGVLKYLHTPKAPAERVESIETRLERVEGVVSEMEQLLTGADADADPGILMDLQDSIDEVRSELNQIKTEMQKANNNNE